MSAVNEKKLAFDAATAEYVQAARDESYDKGLETGKQYPNANPNPGQPPTTTEPTEPGTDSGKFTQEDIDKAVAAAIAALPADSTPFNQEDITKAVSDALSALPADITPFGQADLDKAVAESAAALKAEISDLKIQLSQKDADALEEAIADELTTMADKLRARTLPKSSDPVEETPAEEKA